MVHVPKPVSRDFRDGSSPISSSFPAFSFLCILFFLFLVVTPAVAADSGNDTAGTGTVPANTTAGRSGLDEMNRTQVAEYAYDMVYKGIECSYAGNYACTKASFDAAHIALPNDSGVMYNYAVALANMKRYAESVEKIDQALVSDPEEPYLWYLRGAVLRKAGDFAESGRSYERAADLDPDMEVSFFDHYPANFIQDRIMKNIAYIVLLVGFGVLGIYIWFNEKRR